MKHTRIALVLAAATGGCGARSELPDPPLATARPDGPPDGLTDTFESPCTAALLPGAPAAILGYCPTRTHRSRSSAPWAPIESRALQVLANSPRVGVDGDGRVFVVVDTEPSPAAGIPGALAGLDADGSVAWQTELDGYLAGTPLLGASGTILLFATISGGDRALVEFTGDGEVARTIPVPFGTNPDPGIGEDGALYVTVDSPEIDPNVMVVALEPDGTPRWTFATPGYSIRDVAVGPGDAVVVAIGEEVVWIGPDGIEAMRRGLARSIASGPAIADDGAVYVTTHGLGARDGDALHVFEADGTKRFETPLLASPRSDEPIAIARDGTAYIPTLDEIFAVAADGSIRWKAPLDEGPGEVPYGCAIDAHGTVIVSSRDLVARDPSDGAELWRLLPTPPDGGGPPCIDAVTIGPDRLWFRECGRSLRVASGR